MEQTPYTNPDDQQEINLEGKSLYDTYIHYCTAYKCRPNSDIITTLKDYPTDFCKNGTVSLDGNYVGDRGILPVLEVVKRIPECKKLSLKNNGIRNPGVRYLVNIAKIHPSLTSIDLSQNAISLGGGNALLELVKANPRIVEINLDKTRIEIELKMRIQKYIDRNKPKH